MGLNMNKLSISAFFYAAYLLSTHNALSVELSVVDDSKWCVGSLESGRKTPPHPVPWHFSRDGQVSAGDLWSGLWRDNPNGGLDIIILASNGEGDKFRVEFVSNDSFIAWKGDIIYRWGQRTNGNNC